MQDTLIDHGVSLMLYGMGTVFVFLTILVIATTLMSKLVNIISPEKVIPEHKPATPVASNTQATPNPQVLEAIKQAIASHRQR